MKTYKISTKIKIIGAMFVITMFTVITSTIFLNQKNIKDSLRINIAGKERMLTQKMAKNIFFTQQFKKAKFIELDKAISEFEFGLNTLKKGNELLGIKSAPTEPIKEQIAKVELLWSSFKKNIEQFKSAYMDGNEKLKKASVEFIASTNNELLNEVDLMVSMFTKYSEEKTNFIKKFQYIAMAVLFYLVVYSILQLRQIETHAKEFMEKSKQLANNLDSKVYEPIEVEAESEIVEAANNINCFINKLNSAMQYSQEAVEHSKSASKKLEELTDEFDTIIDEMENSSSVLNQLDKSEDIALDSTENLLKTTKKLQELKSELDNLLVTCKGSLGEK